MANSPFEAFARDYRASAASGVDLMWPSETLVRCLKGSYIPGLDRDYRGKSLLDMGFGNGNNLPLYHSLGAAIHGVEVNAEICALAAEKLDLLGCKADLRVGTNTAIPYPDDTFDYLVSWNVIHYTDNEAEMQASIKEYRRVLKPGGRFFISTTGPEHLILDGAETVGCHLYRIGREDDFRKGSVYFYFDAANYIHYYFDPHFDDVLVGRTHDQLFTATLDWFVITGCKPR